MRTEIHDMQKYLPPGVNIRKGGKGLHYDSG